MKSQDVKQFGIPEDDFQIEPAVFPVSGQPMFLVRTKGHLEVWLDFGSAYHLRQHFVTRRETANVAEIEELIEQAKRLKQHDDVLVVRHRSISNPDPSGQPLQ